MNIIKEINGLLSAGIGKIKSTSYEENSRKLYNLLNTKYSEAWKMFGTMSGVLYRGKSFSGYVLEQVPSLRASQNTSNVYTRLLSDILPSWQEYPKRNKSFICTSSYNKAREYDTNGGLYIIFPENGAKIGICPRSDIWDSFAILEDYYECNLARFNRMFLNYLTEKTDTNKIEIDDISDIFLNYSNAQIIRFFKKLDKSPSLNLDDMENYQNYMDFVEDIENHLYEGGSLISFLNKILDPVKNGFKYTNSIKEAFTPYPDNNEIWVEGTCLLLNFSNYNYFKTKEMSSRNSNYKAMYKLLYNVMSVLHKKNY